jgi:hypothetical protein
VIEIRRFPDFKLKLVDDSREDAKLLLYLSETEVPPGSSCIPNALSERERFLKEFDLFDSRRCTLGS